MGESGKMIWNASEGYLEYKSSLKLIQNSLCLGDTVDYIVRPELAPYITNIMKYISRELLLISDVRESVQRIFDIETEGADMIVEGNALELSEKIGGLQDIDETDELKYDQELFIFSWSNILSSLSTRLKIMNASWLNKPIDAGCPCQCTHGETQLDWDNYMSGVWPNDEGTLVEENTTATSSVQGTCGCSYRTN